MEAADSLNALISMVGSAGVKEEEYMGGFQNLEEVGEQEEFSGEMPVGKKRRLSVQQVRSLEQKFEVENKLEPERKLQLAKELGLQPRQVAVWFQNRRARWKTKQLERDYGVLKLNYDALKSNFDAMQRDNQKLAAELTSLKKKLEVTGKRKADVLLKDEDKENRSNIIMDSKPLSREAEQQNGLVESKGIMVFNEKLEGSESDSSAILNDHAALAPGNNSPRPIDSYICTSSSLKYSTTHLQEEASRDNDNNYNNNSTGEGLMEALCCPRSGNNNNNIVPAKAAAYNHQHCIRMEDNEESCHFFNVEDPSAATLPWWEWS